jgi:hypothetical protein
VPEVKRTQYEIGTKGKIRRHCRGQLVVTGQDFTWGGLAARWQAARWGSAGFKMLGSAANSWKGAIFGGGFIGAAGNITQQLIDTVNGNQLLKASAAGFVGGSIGCGLGKGFSGSGNPLACTTSTPSALGQVLIGGGSGMATDAIMQVAEKGFSDFSFRQMLGATAWLQTQLSRARILVPPSDRGHC